MGWALQPTPTIVKPVGKNEKSISLNFTNKQKIFTQQNFTKPHSTKLNITTLNIIS
jgi:hypothetical protein